MGRLDLAKDLAQKAGEIARGYFKDYASLSMEYKSSPQDMVTVADLEVEKFLLENIFEAYPEDGFFGEEGGIREGNGS